MLIPEPDSLPDKRALWLFTGPPAATTFAVFSFVLLTTLFLPYALIAATVTALVVSPISHIITEVIDDFDGTDDADELRNRIRARVEQEWRARVHRVGWHLLFTGLIPVAIVTTVLVGTTAGQWFMYADGRGTVVYEMLMYVFVRPLMLVGGLFVSGTGGTELVMAVVQTGLFVTIALAIFARSLYRPSLYDAVPDDPAASAWRGLHYPRRDPVGAVSSLGAQLIISAIFFVAYFFVHGFLIIQPATGRFGTSPAAVEPAPLLPALVFSVALFLLMSLLESGRRYLDAHLRERLETRDTLSVETVNVRRWVSVAVVIALLLTTAASGIRVADEQPYDPQTQSAPDDPAAQPLDAIDSGRYHLSVASFEMNSTFTHSETRTTFDNAPNETVGALPERPTVAESDTQRSHLAIDRSDGKVVILHDGDASAMSHASINESMYLDGALVYETTLSGNVSPSAADWQKGAGKKFVPPPGEPTDLFFFIYSSPYQLVYSIDSEPHFSVAETTDSTVTYTVADDGELHDYENAQILEPGAEKEERQVAGRTVRADTRPTPREAYQRMVENETRHLTVVTDSSIEVTVTKDESRLRDITVVRNTTTYTRPFDRGGADRPELVVERHTHRANVVFSGYGTDTVQTGPEVPNPITNFERFVVDVVDY